MLLFACNSHKICLLDNCGIARLQTGSLFNSVGGGFPTMSKLQIVSPMSEFAAENFEKEEFHAVIGDTRALLIHVQSFESFSAGYMKF